MTPLGLFDKKLLFIIVVFALILIIISLFLANFELNSESFQITNKYAVIKIKDYNLDWNKLASLIIEKSSKYEHIIVLVQENYLSIISSALSYMLVNINIPIIVTDKLSYGIKAIKNKILPYDITMTYGDELFKGSTTYIYNDVMKGQPIEPRQPNYNDNMYAKFVDPDIRITIVPSSPNLDLLKTCDGEALILNVSDESHINNNLIEQLNELTNKGIPKVLINQTNGDLFIPSFKMTNDAAYAKLAVLMSNLKNKNFIESAFGE